MVAFLMYLCHKEYYIPVILTSFTEISLFPAVANEFEREANASVKAVPSQRP